MSQFAKPHRAPSLRLFPGERVGSTNPKSAMSKLSGRAASQLPPWPSLPASSRSPAPSSPQPHLGVDASAQSHSASSASVSHSHWRTLHEQQQGEERSPSAPALVEYASRLPSRHPPPQRQSLQQQRHEATGSASSPHASSLNASD